MADEPNKFTHIGVLTDTQKMIGILARVANGGQGVNIYSLVDTWAKDAWEEAKAAGVVTDAMLNPPAHWVAPTISTTKKRRIDAAESSLDSYGQPQPVQTTKRQGMTK